MNHTICLVDKLTVEFICPFLPKVSTLPRGLLPSHLYVNTFPTKLPNFSHYFCPPISSFLIHGSTILLCSNLCLMSSFQICYLPQYTSSLLPEAWPFFLSHTHMALLALSVHCTYVDSISLFISAPLLPKRNRTGLKMF